MSKNLRVGFIGCGRHATKMLYPSLHLARLELVAVCDIDELKANYVPEFTEEDIAIRCWMMSH